MSQSGYRLLIRMAEVQARSGLSVAQIYRLMAKALFPRSVATGPNSRAWVEDEVDAWIRERIAARDDGTDAALRTINKRACVRRPASTVPSKCRPTTNSYMPSLLLTMHSVTSTK